MTSVTLDFTLIIRKNVKNAHKIAKNVLNPTNVQYVRKVTSLKMGNAENNVNFHAKIALTTSALFAKMITSF